LESKKGGTKSMDIFYLLTMFGAVGVIFLLIGLIPILTTSLAIHNYRLLSDQQPLPLRLQLRIFLLTVLQVSVFAGAIILIIYSKIGMF
jgi:hypothetical protein